MNKNKWIIIALVVQVLGVGSSQAALVVDTGIPTGAARFLSLKSAGEFTLNAQTTITAIEHYMRIDTKIPI